MLIPTRPLDEPLRAELAGVGFLPGVDPLVGLHVHFLHEGLAAKLARELLLLEVDLFVAFPARRGGELFAADRAERLGGALVVLEVLPHVPPAHQVAAHLAGDLLPRPVRVHGPLVCVQPGFLWKPHPARGADERRLAGVNPQVDREVLKQTR